jgi:hypothetical protein
MQCFHFSFVCLTRPTKEAGRFGRLGFATVG